MPTANTSRSSAKGAAKAARKTSTTRRAGTGARKRTTKVKAAGAKTRRARALGRAASASRPAQSSTGAPELSVASFGDYAERALLIPVGAALIARDRVISSVNDTISNYSTSAKAQAQLRRFERRGATARNRLEREVRKTRIRFERELRQRRRRVQKGVSNLERRRDTVTKNGSVKFRTHGKHVKMSTVQQGSLDVTVGFVGSAAGSPPNQCSMAVQAFRTGSTGALKAP